MKRVRASRPSPSQHWRTVLVVIRDPFAREQPALVKAAAVARRCGARLLLFHSFMVPEPPDGILLDSRERIIAATIRHRRERLLALAKSRRLHAADCLVEWDYPAYQAIVRAVFKAKPDVVMTDAHRHRRLMRMVLANTDWELIRNCPCPVWFVRDATLPRRPELLVAVDPRHARAKPAHLDERLLETAASVAGQLGGRISLVHAYENPTRAIPAAFATYVRVPESRERIRKFAAQTGELVRSLGAAHGIAAEDCMVEEGDAQYVIAAAKRRRGADMVVMGAVSRSLSKVPTIGGTAERVIDEVDCDVLVVKPAGFKSPVPRYFAPA